MQITGFKKNVSLIVFSSFISINCLFKRIYHAISPLLQTIKEAQCLRVNCDSQQNFLAYNQSNRWEGM